MSTTYPPTPATVSGDSVTIHRFLKEPTLVARRLQTLLDLRYVADFLLRERLTAAGGSITYESGEPLGTSENPRAVAPGAEYPLVTIGGGAISTARTTKWGQDALVTDEAISRLKMSPVNRALTKLANQNVMFVDGLALSAIVSALTASGSTRPATASWRLPATTAEQILRDVLLAKADAAQRELGIDHDTVVLDDITYAWVKSKFIASGYLPRESTIVTDGAFPRVEGLTWVPTSHGPSAVAALVDTDLLGGMADENIESPGYVRAGVGVNGQRVAPVESKTIREDQEDRYRLRARRVTVPVILEPYAGTLITGVAA